jgi:NAD(P)-dependent dehydrogenase (short-subunit alcohol dehydrogenase family)
MPANSDRRPIALITGATRGIGLGIAQALARDGWDLVLTGMRPVTAVSAVVSELESIGARVHYIVSDIANKDARASLVDTIATRYGSVNALVNNAGRAPAVRADLLEATEDSFESLITTNLQGPYFLTQAVARAMVAHKTIDATFRAAIVFVTSVSADMASMNRGDYCVSKAGLAMATKLFAVRLAAHHIPVYEVRPGIVATDMTAGVREIYDRRIADGLIPEGRWGQADDIGRSVNALLRGDIPYATGTVIHVDGGLSVPRL